MAAITGVTSHSVCSSSWQEEPGFSNNYLVNFYDYGIGSTTGPTTSQFAGKYRYWENPVIAKWYEECTNSRESFQCSKCVHQLYVPPECEELTEIFQKQLKVFSSDFETFISYNADPFSCIFSFLEIKQLVTFSEVSKGCYCVAKSHSIWMSRLHQLLPNVHCLPLELCPFTAMQQTQIICKHIFEHRKPYLVQFKHNEERVQQLQQDGLHRVGGDYYYYYRGFVGRDYDGTEQSIAPDSKQGLCLLALQNIHLHFDDQEKFEELIQLTAVAKQNQAPDVEEVEEDSPYTVDLTVNLDVGFGNSLLICGKGGGLSWHRAYALPLRCVGKNQWKIRIPTDVKEFKIVLQRKDGSMHWEKGKNRVLSDAKSCDIKKIRF